jgi:alkylated DNA repair dioxygenase AlkB
MTQIDVFSETEAAASRDGFPDGFRYAPELISPEDEVELLARIRDLPFREFEFHGYKGKRRVVSLGWQYDFTARELYQADAIPPFLEELRDTASQFAGVEPSDLQHVLITEYGAGAGIGWHRDKPEFGVVVGISLLSPCVFRLRRKISERRWERLSLIAEPRSAYLLSGTVRDEWEHSIPSVSALRYSVTFRNLRT